MSPVTNRRRDDSPANSTQRLESLFSPEPSPQSLGAPAGTSASAPSKRVSRGRGVSSIGIWRSTSAGGARAAAGFFQRSHVKSWEAEDNIERDTLDAKSHDEQEASSITSARGGAGRGSMRLRGMKMKRAISSPPEVQQQMGGSLDGLLLRSPLPQSSGEDLPSLLV